MQFHPSYCLLGASPFPLDVGYLCGGFQHSPVDGCSVVSCNFGILVGGDEHNQTPQNMTGYQCLFCHRKPLKCNGINTLKNVIDLYTTNQNEITKKDYFKFK